MLLLSVVWMSKQCDNCQFSYIVYHEKQETHCHLSCKIYFGLNNAAANSSWVKQGVGIVKDKNVTHSRGSECEP